MNDAPLDRRELLDLLKKILGEGTPQGDVQLKALDLLALIGAGTTGDVPPGTSPPFAVAAISSAAVVPADSPSGNRRLVYVHGICRHVAGFSDPWWAALQPFVPTAFGAGVLGQTRLEVLWSDVVTGMAEADMGPAAPALDPAQAIAAAEIREAMLDRVDRHALDAGPRAAAGAAPLAFADARSLVIIPGLECVEDFSIYLVNDAVRQQIIDRFTGVVRPLLQRGLEVDIISHSWGTVVAFEALRELEDGGLVRPLVRNFFTVGAALSMGPVKLRLRPANQDGRRPAMVRRWVNLNAHGDIVGGPLMGRPYQVDSDFPNLDPFGCASLFGIVDPLCAHGSYFQIGNVVVNRDLFGKFINQPQDVPSDEVKVQSMSRITINGVSLDPATQRPAMIAAGLEAADASQSNYLLIQTARPLTVVQKKELAGKGVTILEYVPDDTYVCHYPPSDLAAIRSLPYVAWANTYMQGFKVDPALIADPSSPKTATAGLLQVHAAGKPPMDRTLKTVDIVFQNNVDPQTLRKKVADAARLDPNDLKPSTHKVRLSVERRYLHDLSLIDEVRHIEEVTPMKLHNNVARGILSVGIPLPGAGVALEGNGQVVAVADTGFDKGSTTNVHPAFTGRVVKLYDLGRPGKANDPKGHGTHVAGSILGDLSSATMGGAIRGTAPKSKLVLQSVLDPQGGLGGLPDDLHELFQTPYLNDQARVHSNSWGSTIGDASYDQNSRDLDDFVWNHRDCVIVFAAGNEATDSQSVGRVDPGSLTPPGTAKNCITVGATENDRPNLTLTYGGLRPDRFPAAPIAPDRMADNPAGMAAFSSRGPTRDHRIKPDVVAPGTGILSTLSRDVANASTIFGTSADPQFFFDAGTSMATPLVAGCAAVVREYLMTQRGIATPSAALVKAFLINGARDIAGQYVPSEAGSEPNINVGFGRVDLEAAIGPFQANENVIFRDENTALDTDADESTTVTIAPHASNLKVTLVWTDPPGETLQNDLDLIVRASDGTERHGNVVPPSTGFDRNNNVEQVVWTGVPAGPATITVRAFRIPQSAQSYALVIRTA